MTYENIRYEVRGATAQITLDRPKVMNALNRATLAELDHAVAAAAADDAIRAVLLTGSGEKAFAAGADIQELADVNGPDGQALAQAGQAIFDRIENCGKPVIALVNGFALGGGCELAMACAVRIGSETARLGQPEVKLGLIPGYGGTQRLPRLVGKGAALKLLLTGDIVNAAEALRIGLLDEVVPQADLLRRGDELAQAIARVAPVAVRQCLTAVHDGYDLPLARALELEASLFGLCCGTADKSEGTRAFLEKRAANWQGK
jgi:enoyl-CoA hydratase